MEPTTRPKLLYKSRTDRMIDGVCGGVAAYAGIDATIVRLVTVILAVAGGFGVLLYIVAAILMPREPEPAAGTEASPAPPAAQDPGRILGIVLLGAGLVLLLGNLGFRPWHHWWGFSWGLLLPLLLVAVGVAVITGMIGGKGTPGADGAARTGGEPARRWYKSRADKKLFGVCGGLAVYLNLDPTIVRLLFVVAAIGSVGTMVIIYLVLAVIVPAEPVQPHTTVQPA